MKKEEIHLGDIHRILFGQAPPEFLLEVFIRTLIVYIAAIVVMQWLGKRMNGQISIMELAVMVTMGAILSPAMQLPDRGVFMALLALLCTLLFLRGINWAGFKNSKFEKLTQGDVSLLVKDGELQLDELENSRISRQMLYSNFRGEKIYHLGKVNRLYLKLVALLVFTLSTIPGQVWRCCPRMIRNCWKPIKSVLTLRAQTAAPYSTMRTKQHLQQ